MRPAAGNNNLDFERLKKPELIKTRIEYSTSSRKLLKFQVYQKVEWQEYNFQELVNSVVVKSIVTSVDAKFVEELKE